MKALLLHCSKKIVGTLWKHIKSQGEEILADIYTDMDWVVCYK